jgi:uncharacterized protein YfeS
MRINKQMPPSDDSGDENINECEEEFKKQSKMAIAQNLSITAEEMKLRRYMDVRRW